MLGYFFKLMVDLLYEDLTYKLQGCFYEVYNTLGYGHKEDVYQNALEKELKDCGIEYKREKSIKVVYKGESTGFYRPDFLIENKVIVEIKALHYLPSKLVKQLINYLKTTEYQLGFMVNFGAAKLQVVRRVWTDQRRISNE